MTERAKLSAEDARVLDAYIRAAAALPAVR
jgi:hypothetical protein